MTPDGCGGKAHAAAEAKADEAEASVAWRTTKRTCRRPADPKCTAQPLQRHTLRPGCTMPIGGRGCAGNGDRPGPLETNVAAEHDAPTPKTEDTPEGDVGTVEDS